MSEKFWTIRNYQTSDFENYARLHIETEKLDQTGHHVSKQILAEALGHPSFHPRDDLFLAQDGQHLIGFASVFLEPGIGRALLDGLVHPGFRRKGVATDLFEHAIKHAKAAGIGVVQISLPETNLAAKQMLSGLGLNLFRHFIGYKLDISNLNMPEVLPGKYNFRNLQPGEEEELTDIQNCSFTDTWGFNPNTPAEIAYRINSSSCKPENVISSGKTDFAKAVEKVKSMNLKPETRNKKLIDVYKKYGRKVPISLIKPVGRKGGGAVASNKKDGAPHNRLY